MGSSVNYNITAGFKAIDAWQRNLVRNAAGLLQPGYNRTRLNMGTTPGANLSGGRIGTAQTGGANAQYGGGDTLSIGATTIDFRQGTIDPAYSPTSLAIRGNGFFLVAQNLRPGAKVFLTRNGDFHYDAEGRLVNSQGLFVVGGAGTLSDPPAPVRDPGDGTVVLSDLTLGRVPVRGNLALSAYGPLIYEATDISGPIQAFPDGRPEVGFVQSNSREMVERSGAQAELLFESNQATQTYKIFKNLLDEYNKATDEAINVVK